jgi:hypothetical protein
VPRGRVCITFLSLLTTAIRHLEAMLPLRTVLRGVASFGQTRTTMNAVATHVRDATGLEVFPPKPCANFHNS